MGNRYFVLALGICACFVASPARAQSAAVTSTSELAPPVDPPPTAEVMAARQRPRGRFGVSGGFGGALSGFTAGLGVSAELSFGAQLNDRWAIYAQGLVHSVFVFNHLQAALLAEWSAEPTLLTLSFGAGVSSMLSISASPCLGCTAPEELALVLPVELGVHTHLRPSTDVHRSGFRLGIQVAPTVALWRNRSDSTGTPLGLACSLQFGWALR